MKTEKQSCCFCFNIALEENIVDGDILDLLKFLTVNVDTSVLENSTVCDDCLNKIIETCEYKRKNSSEMLVGVKKEVCPENTVVCQKCKTVCEREESVPLVDCVTEIDWSDFVNYLFVEQDSQPLESSQICGSCRMSVLNIQQFLKLIYVYDQSKMKCDVDYGDDIKATTNTNLVEEKIEQEFEKYVTDKKTKIENVIEDNKTEVDDSGYISYANFKCKNEEVDLKLEYDNQLTDRYEQRDGKEITSSVSSNVISSIQDEQSEQGVNSENWSNNMKVYNNPGSRNFTHQIHLDNHLLKIHKRKENVASKIHECDKCSYKTTNKSHLMRHKLTHGVKVGLEKYKCHNCVYETYNKYTLIDHLKMHNNIQDINCILCLKKFTKRKYLDDHLLKVHKSKDSVTSKIHECDNCSYKTTNKGNLLRHKLKHEKLKKYKCQHCIYETYDKSCLMRHIKIHNNIRDFKCSLCSKEFTYKKNLDYHLLEIHKCRNNITNKTYECDKCSFATVVKSAMLQHNLKHGIIGDLKILKCHHCTYETYNKSCIIDHIGVHKRNFMCTFCSKNFIQERDLDDHLLKVHKTRGSAASKIYKCDKCSYATIARDKMMQHCLKHETEDHS